MDKHKAFRRMLERWMWEKVKHEMVDMMTTMAIKESRKRSAISQDMAIAEYIANREESIDRLKFMVPKVL